MTANDNRSAVLTVAEIAERWKCHRQSVMDKIHDGEIQAFKIGRSYRIALKDVIRYEEGRAA